MGLKSIVLRLVPSKLIKIVHPLYKPFGDLLFKQELKKINRFQNEFVKKVKQKDKINVIFLVIHNAVWKYEEVYKLLDEDPTFDVRVVVVPLVRNNEGQLDNYYQTLNYFKNNKYNTIGSFDEENKEWLDIKSITNPDLVFFTNPHKLTFDKYYITNFLDKLTCYVPYAFVVIHSISSHYNQPFHHYLWKHFIETKKHKHFSKKFQLRLNANTLISGFPGLDKIYSNNYLPKNPWKNSSNQKTIKIIWAPHHTIKGQGSGLDYSSFNNYFDFFMSSLKNNQNIQIAFKPHPLLKEKLYLDKDWGQEKTDAYYNKWDELDNGQLEESEYIDLFYYSDAMIMDSASFIVEYLYFDKPILFTKIDDQVLERFNSFGQEVFNYMYQASNEVEVNEFITEIVLEGNDELKDERNKFLKQVVLPQNGKTASENIYTELIKELCL